MTNSTYKPLLIESLKATSDLKENRFVGFDGKYCGAGEKALGVVDVSTANNQYVPIALYGILLVDASGTISIGDSVASDSEGKAVKAENSAISNGYALKSAVAGQKVKIIRGI